MFTPWGAPLKAQRFEPGITATLTQRNGGLMLARGYAERRLTAAALKRATRFGEYYAYSFDGAWVMAAVELPHLWGALASFGRSELEREPRRVLCDILLERHPDYLAEVKDGSGNAGAARLTAASEA